MSTDVSNVAILWAVDWEGTQQRSHHFARHLASRGHRCLYVEPAHSVVTAVARNRRLLRYPFGRVWRPLEGVVVVGFPLGLPFSNSSKAVRRLNSAFLRAYLRRAIRRLSFSCDVCMCVAPESLRILDAVEARSVAFDILDDYSLWPGQTPAGKAVAEEEIDGLLSRASVVFAVSRHLADRYGPKARRMVYLPNGVDNALFSQALTGPVAQEIESLSRPVIGYIGMLQTFFDLETVRRLAVAHPDYQIVLVGAVKRDIGPLEGLVNVHMLGLRPYAELPSFLAGFEVAIIPFLLTEASLGASPSKVYQYLAAGRKVVATRMPELEPLADVVIMASTFEEFEEGVETSLACNVSDGLELRLRRAAEGDWTVRVDVLEEELRRAGELR